jgi:hypothetical protein
MSFFGRIKDIAKSAYNSAYNATNEFFGPGDGKGYTFAEPESGILSLSWIHMPKRDKTLENMLSETKDCARGGYVNLMQAPAGKIRLCYPDDSKIERRVEKIERSGFRRAAKSSVTEAAEYLQQGDYQKADKKFCEARIFSEKGNKDISNKVNGLYDKAYRNILRETRIAIKEDTDSIDNVLCNMSTKLANLAVYNSHFPDIQNRLNRIYGQAANKLIKRATESGKQGDDCSMKNDISHAEAIARVGKMYIDDKIMAAYSKASRSQFQQARECARKKDLRSMNKHLKLAESYAWEEPSESLARKTNSIRAIIWFNGYKIAEPESRILGLSWLSRGKKKSAKKAAEPAKEKKPEPAPESPKGND